MEFKIENTEVYGLENSLRSAGNPLRVEIDNIKMNDEIKYWTEKNKTFLKEFYDYQKNYGKLKGLNTKDSCCVCGSSFHVQKNNKFGNGNYFCSKHNHQLYRYGKWFETTPEYKLNSGYVSIYIPNNEQEIKISYDSLIDIFYNYPTSITDTGYVKLKNGELLHRFLMKNKLNENNLVVDHINHDKLDNCIHNLRICTIRENTLNATLSKNNTTKYIGVTWKKDKNKFKAYINIDNKQIHLGYFTDINEAVKARLLGEKQYFGEYAPQRHLFKEFSIEEIEINQDFDKSVDNHMLEEVLKRYRLTTALGTTKQGCGEDNFLNGIIVQFDLYAPLYMWKQLQRYHFLDFISSQSTMHRLVRFDIKEQCVDDVDDIILKRYQELLDQYNFSDNIKDFYTINDFLKIKNKSWRTLVASLPCGFVLGATMTTNYRQLKTIYNQRKNHKLNEWHEFCYWCEKLPYFKELCLNEKS